MRPPSERPERRNGQVSSKEESTELSEDNYQHRLRVNEVLQGKCDDVTSSPNSRGTDDFRKELRRLQHEPRAKDSRMFARNTAVDKRTTEEITEIMTQRNDAILKTGRSYVDLQDANTKFGELKIEHGGVMEVV